MAYIFQCAEDAHREITSIFEFVQPTVIALWNLRWQVQGFLSQVPNASSDDLANRFALGSGMRGGELRRACVETSWERQQSEFAEFVLSSVVAAFEDYTARLSEIAGGSDKHKRLVGQSLQFPKRTSGAGAKGFAWALSNLNNSSSNLSGVFRPTYERQRTYSPSTLNELLICYRFFKCLRNMVAHNGGRADSETVGSYARFAAIANEAALGVAEVPKHHPANLGKPIKLELRGVIGLSDVVLGIIRTYDIELSESMIAETEIKKRVQPILLKKQFAKKGDVEGRIQRQVYGSGLPKPEVTSGFTNFLKAQRIVPHFW